jgi:hypothetical protein
MRDRFAWLLLSATALVAMIASHAIEMWLEQARALGDRAANYLHTGQGLAAEVAIAFAAVSTIAVARSLIVCARGRGQAQDCLVTALSDIARIGYGAIARRLIAIQLVSLVIVELGEERASGFTGNGLAAIAGPGHATTFGVHLIIGLLAALFLYRVARFICARSESLIDAVIAFLRWVATQPVNALPRVPHPEAVASFFSHRSSLLALGLANRPPPFARA